MDELVPGLFYSMVAHMISRSWVVFLARRELNRTAGEMVMASLPVMPTRDLTVARDGFHGSIAVMKERGASKLITVVSFVHVASLGVFVLLLLAIGFVPLIQHFLGAD
ncbi:MULTISPECIES: hypothetical protein [Stenotrophomonas]|uniref:hypothetical protein n=1 Tax=Stenotrophomonas TaxID=40323 RepID=UPI000871F5C1|nr:MULTISPECIES: hypothetical protein [Stenotrophomonas]OEZ01265.1 hypothetical protein BIY45_07475 [Stenotrophomonas sp. BIIR7]